MERFTTFKQRKLSFYSCTLDTRRDGQFNLVATTSLAWTHAKWKATASPMLAIMAAFCVYFWTDSEASVWHDHQVEINGNFPLLTPRNSLRHTHTHTNAGTKLYPSSPLHTHPQVHLTVERQPWQRRLQRIRSSPSLRSALQTKWLDTQRSPSARQSKR